jgi:hypothetical protein
MTAERTQGAPICFTIIFLALRFLSITACKEKGETFNLFGVVLISSNSKLELEAWCHMKHDKGFPKSPRGQLVEIVLLGLSGAGNRARAGPPEQHVLYRLRHPLYTYIYVLRLRSEPFDGRSFASAKKCYPLT